MQSSHITSQIHPTPKSGAADLGYTGMRQVYELAIRTMER